MGWGQAASLLGRLPQALREMSLDLLSARLPCRSAGPRGSLACWLPPKLANRTQQQPPTLHLLKHPPLPCAVTVDTTATLGWESVFLCFTILRWPLGMGVGLSSSSSLVGGSSNHAASLLDPALHFSSSIAAAAYGHEQLLHQYGHLAPQVSQPHALPPWGSGLGGGGFY